MSDKEGILIAFIIISIIIFFQGIYINKFSNAGIYFGIRIPGKYKEDKDLLEILRNYIRTFTLVNLPIIMILSILVYLNTKSWAVLISIFILLFSTEAIRIIYWKKVRSLKEFKGWKSESRNIVVVDTSLRKPSKNKNQDPLPNRYFLLTIIIPIIVLIVTILNYNRLPDLVPIHFNFQGIADGFAEKGTFEGKVKIYSLIAIQFMIVGVFLYINRIISKGKHDLNGGGIKALIIKKKKFRRFNSIFMLILNLEIQFLYMAIQFGIIYALDMKLINILGLIVIFITLIIYLGISFTIGQGGKEVNVEMEEKEDEIYRDDDKYWILGSIYYNKNDPALNVEKRVGIGYTINAGNPLGMAIYVILGLVMIGTIVYSIYLGV